MYLKLFVEGKRLLVLVRKNEFVPYIIKIALLTGKCVYHMPLFVSSIICFDRNFTVYWLCFLLRSRCAPFFAPKKNCPI